MVHVLTKDCQAAPGETIKLSAEVKDNDGRGLETEWSFYAPGCTLSTGELPVITDAHSLNASFTVPADARPSDCLIAVFACRTKGEKPITRYGEVMITIC